jgi:hypothetical protein
MKEDKRVFVGRIKFSIIAKVGRIKGVNYSNKEDKDESRKQAR